MRLTGPQKLSIHSENFRWLLTLYLVAIGMHAPAEAQNLGSAPQLGLNGSDIYASFRLSPRDRPTDPAWDAAMELQVGVRARKLGLTRNSALRAWQDAKKLLVSSPPAAAAPTAVIFDGTTASALNELLSTVQNTRVRVATTTLKIDRPIQGIRDGTTLDLGTSQLSPGTQGSFLIRIEGARDVTITGGIVVTGDSAVLVSNSEHVVVEKMLLSGLSGDGVVISASHNVRVAHNRMSGLRGPGVILISGTTLSTVEQNDISNGIYQSNWAAGIVVSDRDVDLTSDPRAIFDPGGYWPIVAPVRDRLNPPQDNLIAFNHIGTNASSGIYMDGGVRNIIYSNTILGNAKEGLCLDNGATANVVTSNVIQQNGNRWGQPDNVLQLDFVNSRLPDGTAAAKLPGMSLDNSLYNVVFANNISHNYGGGVKMVRTSFFNVIGLNDVESNNESESLYFRFFGIELGAAGADAPSPELDFTPSRGNVIFSNTIRGTNSSGIFIQGGSDQNEIFDNVIREATDYALESAFKMGNTSRNNLTHLPSLNISSGCCNGFASQY
ncbi:MAG: hypothetical protein JWN34_2998 [Bryobacterales bacterium]|nr:hypothetical protein [Bryobacterales bacterium]